MDFVQWFRLKILEDDDSDLIGQYGEDLTARVLKISKLFGRRGLMLRNVYIPAEIGETTEIDLIYITQKGLFVIESKNFSGWIFGRESDRYWTQSLPDKSKHRFYNPIWQNRGHIKWLKAFLQNEALPCFSMIVFSERCSLKKLQYRENDCAVIQRDELFDEIRHRWKNAPDVLDETQIQTVYDTLSVLQNADAALKLAHIERIQHMLSDEAEQPKQPDVPQEPAPPAPNPAPAEQMPCCPRCGAPLVLRTARQGTRAGKQFMGCSAYPKCRYILNI